MSSAILYLAIIAIWACVLIPRWLKRDSARGAAVATESAVPDDADTDSLPYQRSGPADAEASDDAPSAGQNHTRPAAAPISREQSRQRILKARRRLLWMLLGLAAAAGALAGVRLAAWWVIAPPAVMLAGYLLVLREAGKADAEASQREALDGQQAAREREHAKRARARQAQAEAATVAASVPVTYAAAPVPADYDDEGPGRDFTLGRHHATSAAAAASAPDLAADDDDAYEHTENRLRAVGD